MTEAADRISTLERELEEARALNNTYAWERDKAREERDATERRSEAFWKPRLTAAEAKMGEALAWSMDEIDILSNKMSGFAYPQGMVPARRRDQLDNYRKAVDARRSALQSTPTSDRS